MQEKEEEEEEEEEGNDSGDDLEEEEEEEGVSQLDPEPTPDDTLEQTQELSQEAPIHTERFIEEEEQDPESNEDKNKPDVLGAPPSFPLSSVRPTQAQASTRLPSRACSNQQVQPELSISSRRRFARASVAGKTAVSDAAAAAAASLASSASKAPARRSTRSSQASVLDTLDENTETLSFPCDGDESDMITYAGGGKASSKGATSKPKPKMYVHPPFM